MNESQITPLVQWLIVVVGGGLILFILKEYFKNKKDTALTMKVDMIEKTNEKDHSLMRTDITEVKNEQKKMTDDMNKGLGKIHGRIDEVFKAIPKRASDS